MSKARKYIGYLRKFAQSPNKAEIVKELTVEIKNKGFITGIQSLLHKKIHANGGYRPTFDLKAFTIVDFDKSTKISLPKTDSPKVSIIIPMYNQLDYTFNCINSIYQNNDFKDYEIIIADDNSTDNSNLLKEYFENLIVIQNKVNLGFLKNCNNAAKLARGEYLVFLNNDTQVQKDWLEELLFVFEKYEGVGLVGSKLVYPDGSLQEAGGIVWKDGSAWNFGNGDDPSKYAYNYVKEADYISGASMVITRKLWEEIGGFDELYAPAYYEDTDLCFKVRDKGYKVMYQPFSVAVHFEGVSHGTNLNKGVKQYQGVNHKKFISRWHNELKLKSKNGENVFFEKDRTASKKHVVVVDHYLPQIDKDAGSRCISNYIDTMLSLGLCVKFLGENQFFSKQYEKSFQEKGVEVLYGSEFYFHDQSWRNYIKANLKKIDVFLLSRSSVCVPVITFLRNNNYEGKIIYFGHDLGYLRLEKEAAERNDEKMRAQARKIKAAEDFMYQNADHSLVLSYDEIAYLKKYITKPLSYVPAYFFDVTKEKISYEDREGILFIGGFNHPPNKDAMEWFLNDIYQPLYEKNIPLTIIGSKMPDFIFGYKERYKSLRILSDISVEDLNAIYSKTRIAIIPLRYGAGVKGKVIEAMSKGVPIVGTDVAFEGIPKDEHFIYRGYNTPQEIAENILDVYSSKDKWTALSTYGIDYVSQNFNRETMKTVFKNVIG